MVRLAAAGLLAALIAVALDRALSSLSRPLESLLVLMSFGLSYLALTVLLRVPEAGLLARRLGRAVR
jgi:hypothetical protein